MKVVKGFEADLACLSVSSIIDSVNNLFSENAVVSWLGNYHCTVCVYNVCIMCGIVLFFFVGQNKARI